MSNFSSFFAKALGHTVYLIYLKAVSYNVTAFIVNILQNIKILISIHLQTQIGPLYGVRAVVD